MAFRWRADVGPILRYLDPLSSHQLKKTLSKLPPPLLQNFLDPRMHMPFSNDLVQIILFITLFITGESKVQNFYVWSSYLRLHPKSQIRCLLIKYKPKRQKHYVRKLKWALILLKYFYVQWNLRKTDNQNRQNKGLNDNR